MLNKAIMKRLFSTVGSAGAELKPFFSLNENIPNDFTKSKWVSIIAK